VRGAYTEGEAQRGNVAALQPSKAIVTIAIVTIVQPSKAIVTIAIVTIAIVTIVQPSKAATDEAYDACAALLLRRLAAADGSPVAAVRRAPAAGGSPVGAPEGVSGGVALLLATHNRASVAAATRHMAALGLPASHRRVHLAQVSRQFSSPQKLNQYDVVHLLTCMPVYLAQVLGLVSHYLVTRATLLTQVLGMADDLVSHYLVTRATLLTQILGMADDLTLTLGLQGFNALKLVPYGELQQVLPWLLRRLDENQASQ
jgi:hypothetical protein